MKMLPVNGLVGELMNKVQEEASMDDILSSIRRILTAEQKKERGVESTTDFEPQKEIETKKLSVFDEPVDFTPAVIQDTETVSEPFLLTPAMRVDIPNEPEKAPSVSELSVLTAENQLQPLIQKWLDEHLPDIVEKVIREEVGRVLARVLK